MDGFWEHMGKFLSHIILPTVLILVLPLAGVWGTGHSIVPYLKFPPMTVITAHAPFSRAVFLVLFVCIGLAIFPFVKKAMAHTGRRRPAKARFPWWGYGFLSGLACFWILAWTRFDGFSFFQGHTFFPLWVCFIGSVNALVFRSENQCPLMVFPLRFLGLFPVSALFWWVFEYLNRFVANWVYSGSQYPPFQYFILATLSFSIVLPAVESVKAYLLTFDCFKNGFSDCWPLAPLDSKPVALCMLIGSCALLALVGVFPDILFGLVWICPFFIFLGCWRLSGRQHPFTGIVKGDFTRVVAYAAAALICGVFWELFNFYSLARWQYTIAYVNVAHLFEMPVLGYAGYLPFGLECALIIDLVMKPSRPRAI